MAYGAEAHTGLIEYDMTLNHTSGVSAHITVEIFDGEGVPTESASDAVFQSFLTRISGMAGVTVVSANKHGEYTTPVTA